MGEYATRAEFMAAVATWKLEDLVSRGKYLRAEARAKRATLWERQQLEMLEWEWRRRQGAGLLPPGS